MMLLDESDQLFADCATEIPGGGCVGGGREGADFDGFVGGIGDLQGTDLAIPLRGMVEDSLQFSAERVDGKRIIGIEEDTAEEVGGDTGPILEGSFDEVIDGENEAAQVPDADDDVGEGDFLDAPPFIFDDDDVIDADRLGEGDLEAGEEIGDCALGGEADNDADDSGGGEDAGAELPDLLEEHEDGGEGEDDDDEEEGFFENEDLGMDLTGAQIVGDGDVVAADDELFSEVDDLDEDPGDGTDDEEAAGSGDEPGIGIGQTKERKSEDDCNNGDQSAQGTAQQRDKEAFEMIARRPRPETESDFEGMRGAKGKPEEGGEEAKGEGALEYPKERMIDFGGKRKEEWSDGEV